MLTTGALQDASAEDLLLALLRASASAKEGRPGNAAPRHASEAAQPAKDGSRGLRDALPYLAAHTNTAFARQQRVCPIVRSAHYCLSESAGSAMILHSALLSAVVSCHALEYCALVHCLADQS